MAHGTYLLIALLGRHFFFFEISIHNIQEAGMDWIFHLDTDELIHPAGAREYSLRQLLSDVPANVDMVTFPNYVSVTITILILRFILLTLFMT